MLCGCSTNETETRMRYNPNEEQEKDYMDNGVCVVDPALKNFLKCCDSGRVCVEPRDSRWNGDGCER